MIHNNPHEKEVPQMLKQPSGIYHQKLKFIFMLLAAVVTLVLASVSGIFLSQHWEESYISSITLSRTILEEKSAASLKEISNTMTDIVNDSLIKDWSVLRGHTGLLSPVLPGTESTAEICRCCGHPLSGISDPQQRTD